MLWLGFFFMLVQNYCYMKVPLYMKHMLDEISGQNRETVIWSNIIYIILYTALLVVSLYLMRSLIIGVSRKIEYELRKQIYHQLLSFDYLFFQKNETGDLMSRCTNDLTNVRTLLGPGVMYIPNSLSRLILFLPVLIHLNGTLMLIMACIMTVLVATMVILLPLLRPLFAEIQAAMGTMNNKVWQAISGISAIKQFTAEPHQVREFEELNREYIKKQMAVARLQEVLRPLFVFLFSITELVILWIGGSHVISGKMTIGELLQFNIMISSLTFPILAMGWMMSLLQQGISSLERVNYILEHPVENRCGKVQLTPPGTFISPTTGTFTSKLVSPINIRVENLTYYYPGQEKPAVKDICLRIGPGQTIGITGPVGSGKTTLIHILIGLLKPEPGQIFVNNTDICQIDLEDFFRHIAVVSQQPFLFSRTVAENIGLSAREISFEAIKNAAQNAGLENDIQTFPDGYNQAIGERGITLSGGQKQRVAIARALVQCSSILVMDDPLSNVDARTEEHILSSLKEHGCYQTLILVSHRISVLKITDIVYVMDGDRIVEQGSHMDLVLKGGLYSRLARTQQMEMELDTTGRLNEKDRENKEKQEEGRK